MSEKRGGKREGAGRKKGSGYLTETRKKLLANSDEIIDSLINQAKGGDINALKLCIERLIPVAKELPVFVTVGNIEGLVDQLREIRKQVLNGELSIQDAEKQVEFLRSIDGGINTEARPSIFDFS